MIAGISKIEVGDDRWIEIRDAKPGMHLKVLGVDVATGTETHCSITGLSLLHTGAMTESLWLGNERILTCLPEQLICIAKGRRGTIGARRFDDLSKSDRLIVKTGLHTIDVLPMSSFSRGTKVERHDIYQLTTESNGPFFAGVVAITNKAG